MFASESNAMPVHELKFRENGNIIDHGKVVSDDANGSRLAQSLMILCMSKFSVDYPHFVKSSAECIILRTPDEYDKANRNKKLHSYLLGNGDRCAVCQLGEDGDIGLLTTDVGTKGYLCYLLPSAGVTVEETKKNASENESFEVSVVSASEKVTGLKRGSEQLAAMKHYNENLQRDRSTRHKTLILHLRNLNNCVKSHLIQYGVKRSKQSKVAILDLGCGMGGDILKWLRGDFEVSRYVGVDIAKSSLVQFAGERLKSNPSKEKVTHLICADLGTESLTSAEDALDVHTWSRREDGHVEGRWETMSRPLSVDDTFNVASCQFAMHYMFQSVQKARHFFAEISRHLVSGGVFVATTIDSRVVTDMAAQVEACSVQSNPTDKIEQRRLQFNDDFGNTLLEMSFESDAWNRMIMSSDQHALCMEHSNRREDDWAYGIQYVFQLKDTGEAAAVNAPEWLVPLGDPLKRLALEFGMDVVVCKNFHEIVSGDFDKGTHATHISANLGKFGVFNVKSTMTAAEWRLAHLYVAVVFEKK